MNPTRGRGWIPAIAGLSGVLVLLAATLGARLPGLEAFAPLPRPGDLDYSAGPSGGFAPLDPRLVSQLLGTRLDEPAAPGSVAASMTVRADAPPVPIVVTHRFTNDDFADAYRAPTIPFTATTDPSAASTQPGEPRSCSPLGGGTAWYAFTPPETTGLVADTFGSDYATGLTVYTGAGLSSLTPVGRCSSDARGDALVAFVAQARTTYYFQIAGSLGHRLAFSLNQQGVTSLVSAGPTGEHGDGDSITPAIDPSGRFVVFASGASNLAPGGGEVCVQSPGAVLPCGRFATFMRDSVSGRTIDINPTRSVLPDEVRPSGTRIGMLTFPGAISSNGRYTAFWSSVSVSPPQPSTDPSPVYRFEVFRRDNSTGESVLVSRHFCACGRDAGDSSGRVEMSADGRYVAFTSWAANIVRNDTNGVADVFVRDMSKRTTVRVNVPSGCRPTQATCQAHADESVDDDPQGLVARESGSDLLSISRTGRFVVFRSTAANLVDQDDNRASDVFLRDTVLNRTVRVNVSSAGIEADKGTKSMVGFGLHTVSDDGRYVFFNSDATNLVAGTIPGVQNVYRRDLALGTTELATMSNRQVPADAGVDMGNDALHHAGAYLAPVLVAGGPKVRVTPLSYSGSADGRYVVFNSDAELVDGDTNNVTDVFLRDMRTRTTTRVSVSTAGVETQAACNAPSMSADGRFVAFGCAKANGLAGQSTNYDIFVRELPGAHEPTLWR